jgi:hypothetical protein
MRLLSAILMVLSATACSSRKIRPEAMSHGPHSLLFPYGTYQHQVRIKTAQSESTESKEFAFNGIVKTNDEWIKIASLSPLGTTLVRIQENRRTNHVDFVSYVETFKKYESKFIEYYEVLKELLLAPENPTRGDRFQIKKKNPDGTLAEVETLDLEQNAVFLFKKYDEHQIPEEIQVRHPKFTIEIKVSGYDIK